MNFEAVERRREETERHENVKGNSEVKEKIPFARRGQYHACICIVYNSSTSQISHLLSPPFTVANILLFVWYVQS